MYMNAKQKYVDVLLEKQPDLKGVLFEFEADVHVKIKGQDHGDGAVFVGRLVLYVVDKEHVHEFVISDLHEVKFSDSFLEHAVTFSYQDNNEALKLKFEDKPELVEFAQVMENLSEERQSFKAYVDANKS